MSLAALAALLVLGAESPSAPTSTRVYGSFRSRLGVGTSFDSPPGAPLAENVADLRSWLLLGGEARFGEALRAVAEVRVRHRAVEERQPLGQPFLLVNGQATKATYEIFPGEAFVDWYTPKVDFRFGNQVLAFGANVQGAPADVLDPLDLREGVFFNDPADVKLPVLAARARGELLGLGWTAAYVPFFVPDKFDLVGQDQALLQPGLGALPALPALDRSVEDRQQADQVETERPKDLPQNGDVGLRVTRAIGDAATVGADYVYTREKLPAVAIDPELARFLFESPEARADDVPTALDLSRRIASGEKLVRGNFPRYQVGEVEGSALLGPVQIDADLGYSPRRLYVDTHFNPIFHPTWSGALTVSDAWGAGLSLAAGAQVLYVRGIPRGERLLLVDSPHAEDQAHDAYGAALVALAGHRFFADRLDLEGRGFFDPRQRSRVVGLRATWAFSDAVHGTLGSEFFGGPADSPFGYFRRSDALYGAIRIDL